MKNLLLLLVTIVQLSQVHAQNVAARLTQAVKQLEADDQLRHGLVSIYVADAQTGKVVYEHLAQVGLAPASTQKLFTSVAAFDLLGSDFRYKTQLGYSGKIAAGVLDGNLYVVGSGDPTFGSPRWKSTADTAIVKKWLVAIKKAGITKKINGIVTTNESAFSHQAIPNGWIWEDIGNYYGAGAYALNWRENQYNLYLKAGKAVGDSVAIASSKPASIADGTFVNELSTAGKGTGDNTIIYLGVGDDRNALVKGTIPIGEKAFSIAGATPDPVSTFLADMEGALDNGAIHYTDVTTPARDTRDRDKNELQGMAVISSHLSPPLDSINYWFLRKSINLYGEALLKTLALEKTGFGSTEKGVELLRNYWSDRGIDKAALHIVDGSGLSPLNRVTTLAEVKVLQYAKTRPWYKAFYNALPEFNGMKMKSGSIGGARAYAGYHTAKDGRQYVFSIIVNNYDGSAAEVVRKLYKVLDVLK